MIRHGLACCARVYRIPDGVKYLVFGDEHDYRHGEMLQLLQGAAVQVVLDEGYESVFLWPDGLPDEADAVRTSDEKV